MNPVHRLLIAALLLHACSGTSPASISAEECVARVPGSGGGGGYPTQPARWIGPLGATLEAFRRERIVSDELPTRDCQVQLALELTSDPHLPDPPGKMLSSQSRLVLADVGIPPRGVYLVPTDSGGLCIIVTTDRGHYICGDAGAPRWGFWDPTDSLPYVYGEMPNEVLEVIVVVGTERRSAQLGENAFFYRFRGGVGLGEFEILV